jgi:pSer/pThr/pTyr-binding forkhead associated (FHA) protein
MASAPATKCNIRLADNEQVVFQLDAPQMEGYVIGRSDESTHYTPDIDFARYDSREKGVSRRHAALISYRGAPHVIDLFSVNGTYLNGKRLSPDQPYPLGKFNELRLGTLDVIITVS